MPAFALVKHVFGHLHTRLVNAIITYCYYHCITASVVKHLSHLSQIFDGAV